LAKLLKLRELIGDQIPLDLQYNTYFDFQSHPFDHQKLFKKTDSVVEVLNQIGTYCSQWLASNISSEKKGRPLDSSINNKIGYFKILAEKDSVFNPACIIGSANATNINTIYLEKGARVIGADIYLNSGAIFLGEQSLVEPGAGIKGPTVIGKKSRILQGAYIRENCIIGDECEVKGEFKNVIVMNKGSFSHVCYLGDSICGYNTHFGNQVTAANLGLFEGIRDTENFKPVILKCDDIYYDTGRPKIGICMGDFSQIGCNSVTDPGTFLKPSTVVYPLTRIPKGFYGPNEILKTKTDRSMFLERVHMRPLEK
jgi:hypothetical protein